MALPLLISHEFWCLQCMCDYHSYSRYHTCHIQSHSCDNMAMHAISPCMSWPGDQLHVLWDSLLYLIVGFWGALWQQFLIYKMHGGSIFTCCRHSIRFDHCAAFLLDPMEELLTLLMLGNCLCETNLVGPWIEAFDTAMFQLSLGFCSVPNDWSKGLHLPPA